MRNRMQLPKQMTGALGWVVAALGASLGISFLLWQRAQLGVAAGGRQHRPGVLGSGRGRHCGYRGGQHGGRFGWLLLFGLQPLWITYALCTDQLGLVLGPLAYAVAQLNGFLRGGQTSEMPPCG